jgi:hypothetical protein
VRQPRPTPRSSAQRVAGALVESPLQLLCTLEAHAAGLGGGRLHVHVRDDVPALDDALAAVRQFDLPSDITFDLAGRRTALTAREPIWLVGDAFSGLFQVTATLRRPEQVVLVDDGLATLELARLLARSAPLVRLHGPALGARRRLGAVAAGRLRSLAGAGRVVIFTALPLEPELHAALRSQGFDVRHNGFSWLSRQVVADAPTEPTVVVGSAMPADGFVAADAYVGWIRGLAADGPLRYFPHRRQTDAVLAELRQIPGVVVDAPGAPVELRLRGLSAGQRVVSLPSTSAVLLTTILGPRGVEVTPHDVPDAWWSPRASTELRAHLRSVLELARAARETT